MKFEPTDRNVCATFQDKFHFEITFSSNVKLRRKPVPIFGIKMVHAKARTYYKQKTPLLTSSADRFLRMEGHVFRPRRVSDSIVLEGTPTLVAYGAPKAGKPPGRRRAGLACLAEAS
ncbi:MAG TPA: hypothetical protein DET40_10030 [Lentisphaeria bacterium]|nr:MAG: hypothetical protein A2X45_08815 [Lentisphaerae bacterium GWF2_50_93]HCE43874.1 hypothetical protein [Lentisphaeria bacterium]